jgi:hypothetical protein
MRRLPWSSSTSVQCRARQIVELDRSRYGYEPRADHNAELREELVKLARQKPRYGCRRLHGC